MAKNDDSSAILRKIVLGDIIEIFRDPESETCAEGYAKVWAIMQEEDTFYTLIVSFMDDPAAPGRKFTRKYKKWE